MLQTSPTSGATSGTSATSGSASAAGSTTSNAQARETGFTAATTGEHFRGETLLVQAYAITWVLVFGYVAMIWRKHGELARRLDALDRTIDAHGHGDQVANKR
jgi:CcmD family protein